MNPTIEIKLIILVHHHVIILKGELHTHKGTTIKLSFGTEITHLVICGKSTQKLKKKYEKFISEFDMIRALLS